MNYDPPEKQAWRQMIYRCRPNHPKSKDYFERGITVCQAWLDSYENFITYIGPRPTEHHSLDRIDNTRGYEPGNVRWATRSEQWHNSRSALKTTEQRRDEQGGYKLTRVLS